jgi:hypothetical protein
MSLHKDIFYVDDIIYVYFPDDATPWGRVNWFPVLKEKLTKHANHSHGITTIKIDIKLFSALYNRNAIIWVDTNFY